MQAEFVEFKQSVIFSVLTVTDSGGEYAVYPQASDLKSNFMRQFGISNAIAAEFLP